MERPLKYILAKHGLTLKKAFGQNFLTDETLLAEIVEKAGITKDDTVVEIGCGAGALTEQLAKKAARVFGYEIDERLKPVLQETLAGFDNVKITFKDVMKEKLYDMEKVIGGRYKVVANLPYYITTPIVMNFLENARNMLSMTIMVQEEVAARFSAAPSNKDYGAITVGINLRGNAETVMKVPREKFTPAPNVDSAVVRIDIKKDKFAGEDLKKVRDCVRVGFSGRRKTIVNNLMNGFKMQRAAAEEVARLANISPLARAENLSAEQFVNLSHAVEKVKNAGYPKTT